MAEDAAGEDADGAKTPRGGHARGKSGGFGERSGVPMAPRSTPDVERAAFDRHLSRHLRPDHPRPPATSSNGRPGWSTAWCSGLPSIPARNPLFSPRRAGRDGPRRARAALNTNGAEVSRCAILRQSTHALRRGESARACDHSRLARRLRLRVRVPDGLDECAPQPGRRDGLPDGLGDPSVHRLPAGQGDRPPRRRRRTPGGRPRWFAGYGRRSRGRRSGSTSGSSSRSPPTRWMPGSPIRRGSLACSASAATSPTMPPASSASSIACAARSSS